VKFTEELTLRNNGHPLAEWDALDVGIRAIVDHIDQLSVLLFGKEIVVTSMILADGTHASARMVDIDVDEKNVYGGILPSEARVIREIVNAAFVYDPARPTKVVLMYGENDPSGAHYDHMHTQVCWDDRTIARNKHLRAWLETFA